jgi:GNAT superfamily N-acetyltransferase
MSAEEPKVKVERVSDARELERVIDLCSKVFSSYYDSVTHWRQVMELDPGYRPGQNFAVYADGRPVANARVTTRRVRIGSAITAAGGIGDVSCDPCYRGRHYPSACLQEAIRFMRETGHTLSLLGTGILDFYRRLGWEVAALRCSLTFPHAAACAVPAGWSLVPFECRMLDAAMELYDRENASRTGSVVRDRQYWERQLAFSLMPPLRGPFDFVKESPEGFLVLHDASGKPRGYMRSRVEGDRLIMLEAAAPDGPAAFALAALAASRAPQGGRIVAPCPPDSLLAHAAVRDLRGELSIQRTGKMARIIDLLRLFRDMEPAFAQRLASADQAPAAIWIETELVGSAGIEWDGKEARALAKPPAKCPRVSIPQAGMVTLVTGYRSVHEVLGAVGAVTPESLSLLEALFPQCYAHMWQLDEF